jgi:hypothetical protein
MLMFEGTNRGKQCFTDQAKAEELEVFCGAFLYKGVRLFLHRKYIASYSI